MSDIKDLSPTLIGKADQLNADQLKISGPIDIVIRNVVRVASKDQPVIIHYDGEDGKPFKPCLTMRRVISDIWGKDGSIWIGRSIRLFCDPEVVNKGEKTGGVRISHMSDFPDGIGEIKVPVTVSRGRKALYPVLKLKAAPTVDYRATLTAATTLDALSKAWQAIPQAQQPALAALKDERKAALTQPTNEETI